MDAVIQRLGQKPSETSSVKFEQTPLTRKGTQRDPNPNSASQSANNPSGETFTQTFDFVIGGEGDYSRVRDLLWNSNEVAQKVPFPYCRLPLLQLISATGLFWTLFHHHRAPEGLPIARLYRNDVWAISLILLMLPFITLSSRGPGSILGAVSLGPELYVWGSFRPKEAPQPNEMFTKVSPDVFLEAFQSFGGPWKTLSAEIAKVLFSFPS